MNGGRFSLYLFVILFIFIPSFCFAVEPTTFPTNQTNPKSIASDDGTVKIDHKTGKKIWIPKKSSQSGTPIKNTNQTGVLIEPTGIDRTAPKTK